MFTSRRTDSDAVTAPATLAHYSRDKIHDNDLPGVRTGTGIVTKNLSTGTRTNLAPIVGTATEP